VVDTAGASNMAQIDPNIALQGRVIQLPNQLAQFSQAQDIGLNALKMQEYQKGVEQENKLRELLAGGADLSSPETIRQMYNISPKMGAEFEKSRAVLKREQTAADKNVADLESQLVKNARDTLGAVNDQSTYDMWRQQTISKLPGLAQIVPPQFSPQAKMSLMADANKYIEQNQISAAQRAQMGVTMRGQDLQYDPNTVANTVTDAAGNVTQFNRFGQVIGKPGAVGKPSATFEKTAALQKQTGRDLDLAIKELTEATKDKGLIDQSTGSGAGRLVDVAAGFAGQATPGAIAIAKLKPIADIALKMVPRFEGPQSDKDTQTYKEAAGQLADPSLPTQIRKEAGREVLRLMKARKGQFVNEAMAAEGIGAGGVDTSNPLLK
jgi:hypothetical protein